MKSTPVIEQTVLADLATTRLHNQQIADTSFNNAVDLLEWLTAVQAQEYALSKWSLGLRLKGVNDTAVEGLLADGKILRTHLLRPTWHFVSANDIGWLLQLTAPGVHRANAFMYRKLELDSSIFHRCHKVLENILQGGKQLTRNRINDVFRENGIVAEGHRLSYIMMHAELEGIICSGARQGNQFTYALLEERVRPAGHMSKHEALLRLTTRYFRSRGPATIKDFATWSGLSITDCKRGVEMVGNNLQEITAGGTTLYAAEGAQSVQNTSSAMYLLPMYDEFIMGYQDRSAMMQRKNSLSPDSPFQYNSMMVQQGQVIGTWKRDVNQDSIDLKVQFFNPPDKGQQQQLEQAVHRFQDFHALTQSG